jgi:Protein of unknown function (DUF2726)
MSLMWFYVVALAVVVAMTALKHHLAKSGSIGFPYQRGKPLFSAAERLFLGVLEQAVGPDHRVFGKVRIADVAAVKPGLGRSARQGALNRIAAKHFDFVVCRAADLVVICAVELNDRSHASAKAQSRDALVANVCRVIGLPLIAVAAKATYSAQEVRAQFLTAVTPAPTAVQADI